jgi:hypothetical protein
LQKSRVFLLQCQVRFRRLARHGVSPRVRRCHENFLSRSSSGTSHTFPPGGASQELFLDVSSTRSILALEIPHLRKYSHHDNSSCSPYRSENWRACVKIRKLQRGDDDGDVPPVSITNSAETLQIDEVYPQGHALSC